MEGAKTLTRTAQGEAPGLSAERKKAEAVPEMVIVDFLLCSVNKKRL